MAVSRDIVNDKVPETSSDSSTLSFPEPQQETFPKSVPPPNSQQQIDITMVSSPKCDRNVLIIMLIHQN